MFRYRCFQFIFSVTKSFIDLSPKRVLCIQVIATWKVRKLGVRGDMVTENFLQLRLVSPACVVWPADFFSNQEGTTSFKHLTEASVLCLWPCGKVNEGMTSPSLMIPQTMWCGLGVWFSAIWIWIWPKIDTQTLWNHGIRWYVRWELSGHIAAILLGAVSGICTKRFIAFICRSHQNFSPGVSWDSKWCSHTISTGTFYLTHTHTHTYIYIYI